MGSREFICTYQVYGIPDGDEWPVVDLRVFGNWTDKAPVEPKDEIEWATSIFVDDYIEQTGQAPQIEDTGLLRLVTLPADEGGSLVKIELIKAIESEDANIKHGAVDRQVDEIRAKAVEAFSDDE